jgi:hypothetical protein
MSAGWTQSLLRRFKTLWVLKGLGTTVFMVVFFWAYFTILVNPSRPPFVVPTMFLDDWVPLTPWAYSVYISLWVYVSLPPAFMPNFRTLMHFAVWITAMCVFCLGIFWWMPTQTPTFGVDWSLHPGLSLIKGVDAPGNAFPSLHVASAVFSAFWLQRMLSNIKAPVALQWINVLHCLAITWSTLATLQHVAWDAISGALVGAAFAWGSLRASHRDNTLIQP